MNGSSNYKGYLGAAFYYNFPFTPTDVRALTAQMRSQFGF
jgi:hypothetical protein